MVQRSDADLAVAWRSGDHEAFAEVYRRYADLMFGVAVGLVGDRSTAADVVHDTFVRAAGRVATLREPDRLRAWLLAILRNEAIDVHRRNRRERAEDVTAMTERMDAGHPEPHVGPARTELAEVIWSAADALQPRDRELLELHVRGGLEAGDLAEVLGVAAGHAAVLLSRMRDRMEKAIGALLVARLGRDRCPILDGALAGWDGRFTLAIRSQVTRHIESCLICTGERSKLASYQRLAPAMVPVLVAPAELWRRTSADLPRGGDPASVDAPAWQWHENGFPHPQAPWSDPGEEAVATAGLLGGEVPPSRDDLARRRWGTAVAGLVVLLLIGVGTMVWRAAAPAGEPRLLYLPSGTADAGSAPAVGQTSSPAGTFAAATGATTAGTGIPAASTPGGRPSVSTRPTGPAASGSASLSPSSPLASSPSASASPPGHLVVSAARLSLGSGAGTTTATVVLTDDGGQPVVWTAATAGQGFTVVPAAGTLAAGAKVTLTVTLTRAGLPTGSVAGMLTVTAPGQSLSVTLFGTVARPPEITNITTPALSVGVPSAQCLPLRGLVTALVTDPDGSADVQSVTLTWNDGKTTRTTAMTAAAGGPRVVTVGPFAAAGTHAGTITATDTHGTATTADLTVTVVACT